MASATNYTKESLENLKKLINIDNVIGTPIVLEDTMIIPLMELKLCFLSGGSDYPLEKKEVEPFGGITGGNSTVKPIGFIVKTKNEVKLLTNQKNNDILDRVFDKMIELFDRIKEKKTNYSSSSEVSTS